MKTLVYIFRFFTNLFCSPAKTEIPEQWNYSLALKYIIEYAKIDRVDLKEALIINTPTRIRGDVGPAEFEYNDSTKVFIVRGLVNKRIRPGNSKFTNILMEKILAINENPPKNFQAAYFEFDSTALEINPKFPIRLNLRMDYAHPIDYEKFKKEVNKLVHVSYAFSQTTYDDITTEVNRIVFPVPKK